MFRKILKYTKSSNAKKPYKLKHDIFVLIILMHNEHLDFKKMLSKNLNHAFDTIFFND